MQRSTGKVTKEEIDHNISNLHQSKSYEIEAAQITTNRNKTLGKGDFAIVYLGTYNQITVAIKEIHTTTPNKFLKEQKILQLIAEAQALDEEKGKNIVKFYGHNNSPFPPEKYQLVLEYVDNGSLDNWIHSTKPIDWNIAYPIINDIVRGLNFLHQLNIFHRDLKPTNILLTKNMQAKIIDFGLSKIKGKKVTFLGTPVYKAPEILEQTSNFTEKSDVYSLSLVLLEIVSKQEPYPTIMYLSELLKHVCENKNRMPIPSDCPDKIGLMINWCWQHKPADRPTTETLLEELKTDIKTISSRFFQSAPLWDNNKSPPLPVLSSMISSPKR